MSSGEDIPLFCVITKEKKTNNDFYVNFLGNHKVQYPNNDLNEEQLVHELLRPTRALDDLTVPVNLGPIFWKKSAKDCIENSYVIDAKINQKFGLQKVIQNETIRHYVIAVILSAIEKKFNEHNGGQFIGHDLDLDACDYKLTDGSKLCEKSNDLVNNKVTPLDNQDGISDRSRDDDSSTYDLFYRPSSKILTCSIPTEILPKSISYNEDRITIHKGDECIMDTFLPFFIDLEQPVKYKFDDKSCLFRAVFRVVEERS